MKRIPIFILFILSIFVSSNAFAATGDIQITCEANVRIFIDNNFKGITNDSDNGLFIEGLTPGTHTLKAIKKGYNPFERNITVTASKAIEVKISFGQRQESVKSLQSEEGQTLSQVGKMELRSVPLGAKVTIDGKTYQQKTDMEIENIPIGQHRISFSRGKQNLSGSFYLNDGDILRLKAHFKQGKIIDIAKLEEEEREAEKIAREKQRREREAQERREINRDDRFIAYANGTVLDKKTNLMWAAKANASNINWKDAKSYCEDYRGGGYTDWRLPTHNELAGLYDSTINNTTPPAAGYSGGYHLTNLIYLDCCCPWASETDGGSFAIYFSFDYGKGSWRPHNIGGGVLPVRSGK